MKTLIKPALLVALVALWMIPGWLSATVYHIRHDGGSSTRCTGLVNAPDPGSGSAQPCAYNSPMWMYASDTAWIAFTTGDTMEFDDPPTSTTPYFFGVGLNGLAPPAGSNAWCTGAPSDCVQPPWPNGAHLQGQNAGSCHNSAHTALNFPTIWSGLNKLFWVLDLQGTNNATIECLAITQPDTCNTLLNGSAQGLAKSSISSGTATYITFLTGGNNNPLPTQRITVSGSTNGANVTNKQVATFTTTTWNITNSSATSTVLTLAYTVTSGDVPRVGQTVFSLSGLTNAGGSYNTSFGNGTIASSSGTTSGTMTITGSFTAASSQAETGTGVDFNSGTATVTGIAGTVALAADNGVMFPAGSCIQGTNNYVQHGVQFELGVNQGPSNLTMRDVAVAGVTAQGFLGSKINTTGTDVSNFSDIYIIGNGLAGWDSDGGGCGTGCESIGHMNLTHVDVEWNGCMAVKPYNFNLPASSNTFDLCFAQNTGGYGDGLSFIAADSVIFTVDQSTFKYNTQDGLDSAHLGDDLTHNPVTTITNSHSEGNMGQTFKMGAGTSSTAKNNFSSGNCRFLITASNVPSNPGGWNAGVQNTADSCRAGGDQWALSFKDGQTVTLENNTSTGQGATMYDAECFPGVTCTSATSFIMNNNVSMGFFDPITGNIAAGIFIGGTFTADPFTFPGSSISFNQWWTMRNPTNTQDPAETNSVYSDPLLMAESSVDAINPNITASSPMIMTGTTPCPTTDFNGTAQTSPCTKGAFVFTSGTPTVATPTFSPVAGSYGPAQSVTISTVTGGASIVYTNDGSTPTVTALTCTITHGTLYTGPVSVSTSQTLNAIGCLSGDNASSVGTAAYVINGPVVNPTCTPPAGTYTGGQVVTCSSSTGGSTTVCTVDGSTPNHGSPVCTSISVATSLTLKALSFEAGWSDSSVISNAYIILPASPLGANISGNATLGGNVNIP